MTNRKKIRSLTSGETALWRAVAESISPLDEKTAAKLGKPHVAQTELSKAPKSYAAKSRAAKDAKSGGPKARAPKTPKQATTLKAMHAATLLQRLHAGDPRQVRRISRGRLPIEATLDLHGLTQLNAEMRLHGFIQRAHDNGLRRVLVITGKGPPANAQRQPFANAPRGILRTRFLEWIEMDPLRQCISSVHPSHQRHGGRGAYYVFLKNAATSKQM